MSGDSRPVELVADLRNVIGEGPVWLEDEQRLVWVDIKGHHVHWLDPKTGRLEQIDSASHRVDVLDYESSAGTIANRRPLIQIDKSDGMPDGMTLDAEGGLWVALWGGWSVRRYRLDGSFDLEIKIPVGKVSSCVFGGPDLSDLYITTAASGLSEKQLEKEPHAGGVFRCRPGHGGRPPYRFGG